MRAPPGSAPDAPRVIRVTGTRTAMVCTIFDALAGGDPAALMAFAAGAFASLCFWIIIALPAAPFYEGQEAFAQTLGPVPLIVLASLLGFLVGQLLNAYVLVKVKQRTRERHLWARLMASTLVGELVDTIIFCAIAAPVIGIETPGQFLNYVLVGYVWKCLIEVVMLPVTYAVVARVKKIEDYGAVTA